MSLSIRNLQVDVPSSEHEQAIAWWSRALGGAARAVDGPYHHLDGVRAPVGVHVQRLDDGPGGYHLDLEADDAEAEAARLVELGATQVGPAGGWEDGTRLLCDPAGLAFCVTPEGQAQHLALTTGGPLRLEVVMFDVSADLAEATAAFWAAGLGGQARQVERFPEYTWISDVRGPGGPLNLAVQALGDGPARLHVDLHCADATIRDTEAAALIEAGAEQTAQVHHWRVLRTPGGPIACIVPDKA